MRPMDAGWRIRCIEPIDGATGAGESGRIVPIQNWLEEINRRVPVR
jgi:hypothetical protein